MVIVTADSIMGSICSSTNNNNNNAALPPKDLGDLVQQAEKGGGSSPWLSEFETYLEKLDRENLARATIPKPPQAPQLKGNEDHQPKSQVPSEFQAPPQQGQAQDVGGDAERSLAWRIPLLRFIIEARTVLNVSTSDHRVHEGLVKLSKEHLCPEGGLPLSGLDLLEN